MKQRVQQILMAAFLLSTWALPMLIGLTHAFHNHDYKKCTAEGEKHIHLSEVKCEIDHFFYSLGDDVKTESQLADHHGYLVVENYDLRTFPTSHFCTFIFDRGPPKLSLLI